ncbi:MAG: hypothetical protein IIA12_01660, partial [Proteobacteria bacterium]|nr:hypothetical protein [Pseudomonadota bacterium]
MAVPRKHAETTAGSRGIRHYDLIALLTLLPFLAAGHWDELLGRSQPVGGDKSAFCLGLMAHYQDCLHSGCLPLWNGRWGFGFPGLAESQVGALYPPHLLLYGFLPVLEAFRWDYLLHRLLAGLVAFACLRGMNLKPLGAWLAAMAYVGGGFALGHQDHQWAVLGMVWLPVAVWATHAWLTFGKRSAVLLLPLGLAM